MLLGKDLSPLALQMLRSGLVKVAKFVFRTKHLSIMPQHKPLCHLQARNKTFKSYT